MLFASVHYAQLTRVYNVLSAAWCTFTLTHTGLLLHVDKFEPHNFCQFSTEQSIPTYTSDNNSISFYHLLFTSGHMQPLLQQRRRNHPTEQTQHAPPQVKHHKDNPAPHHRKVTLTRHQRQRMSLHHGSVSKTATMWKCLHHVKVSSQRRPCKAQKPATNPRSLPTEHQRNQRYHHRNAASTNPRRLYAPPLTARRESARDRQNLVNQPHPPLLRPISKKEIESAVHRQDPDLLNRCQNLQRWTMWKKQVKRMKARLSHQVDRQAASPKTQLMRLPMVMTVLKTRQP